MAEDESPDLSRIFERLPEIAARGDQLATLQEMRIIVAATLLIAPPSNVASLSKALREIMAEIKTLSEQTESGGKLDELRKRRDQRNKGTAP